jgi:hypothetical protein
VTFWGNVILFRVKHYIWVQTIFFIIWHLFLWVSKDAEFNVDSKNINLPLWQNAPKKLFRKNEFLIYTRGSGGHLTKKLVLLFSVLLHKNEYIPGVLSFKIKFSSTIPPTLSYIYNIMITARCDVTVVSFKETVSRDFCHPFFFINRWPLGPW